EGGRNTLVFDPCGIRLCLYHGQRLVAVFHLCGADFNKSFLYHAGVYAFKVRTKRFILVYLFAFNISGLVDRSPLKRRQRDLSDEMVIPSDMGIKCRLEKNLQPTFLFI